MQRDPVRERSVATEHVRRPRLRELRDDHGWTQQDVSERLARLAWLHAREHVGVSADMVAKWERGAKRPSSRYRKLLCLLFGTDEYSLGVGPVHEVTRYPSALDTDSGTLVAALGASVTIIDRLGPESEILQPYVFEAWKEQLMKRRVLLRAIALSPAAAFGQLNDGRVGRSSANMSTAALISDLEELATRYCSLYHSTAPAPLMIPVIAHLRTVSDALRNSTGSSRRALLINYASVSTLAGRLAFHDMGDSMSARGYFQLALEAAREAGDHLSCAHILANTAFIPASEGRYSAALDYTDGAGYYLSKRPSGPLSSFVAAARSEIYTNFDNAKLALSAIDQAREALGQKASSNEHAWFDYYDVTRLSSYSGYASLYAGRLDEARSDLTNALKELPYTSTKQSAVTLTDLASVELRAGDLEHASWLAGNAAEKLFQAGYGDAVERLRKFRAAVDLWRTSECVRRLDEKLALLA
jgi:transcriptional regulator with XRE-family HTH domain